MTAFYNEIDPYAAQWLRNLIVAGHIAPGVVDERSIVELDPAELVEYTQCHFFAGIGVWSYALRLAGWPDDRPVWTGSCPCQPFSAAGKRGGDADERHLWPAWFRLIRERRPVVVFGEQVASNDGVAWLDVVLTDLEGEGNAVAAVDFPAAGVGAPHIRQRLFFMAHAMRDAARQHGRQLPRHEGEHAERAAGGSDRPGHRGPARIAGTVADAGQGGCAVVGAPRLHADGEPGHDATRCGADGFVADADRAERRQGAFGRGDDHAALGDRPQGAGRAREHGGACLMADTHVERRPGHAGPERRVHQGADGAQPDRVSFWAACDWIPCRDGKARPVEPGSFPLAHGATARVGRLRAYGNAINAEAARAFIEAADGAMT